MGRIWGIRIFREIAVVDCCTSPLLQLSIQQVEMPEKLDTYLLDQKWESDEKLLKKFNFWQVNMVRAEIVKPYLIYLLTKYVLFTIHLIKM